MYSVRLKCPQERTNRSRPSHWSSLGSCRITWWNSRYAAGARLIAVPGWPLPTFWTASAANRRTVSTVRTSVGVHPARSAIGRASEGSRPVFEELAVACSVTGDTLRLDLEEPCTATCVEEARRRPDLPPRRA